MLNGQIRTFLYDIQLLEKEINDLGCLMDKVYNNRDFSIGTESLREYIAPAIKADIIKQIKDKRDIKQAELDKMTAKINLND